MPYTHLLYEQDGPIAYLTLNRPEALNALNEALVQDIMQAMAAIASDAAVRVAILAGAGRAWSAGYDLKQHADDPVVGAARWRGILAADVAMTLAVWDCPKPVIAQVHGYCLGGSCELAAMCDLTVAADDAVFGEPEVRMGSGPVSLILPYLLGSKKARELLYTGDTIGADEALALGLVNRVVPRAQLQQETRALALKIARTPPEVIALTKAPINRVFELMGLRQALAANIDASAILNGADLPEQREFDQIFRAQGLKAALAWRDSRFPD
jgi:enoyl-CoA hydratase